MPVTHVGVLHDKPYCGQRGKTPQITRQLNRVTCTHCRSAVLNADVRLILSLGEVEGEEAAQAIRDIFYREERRQQAEGRPGIVGALDEAVGGLKRQVEEAQVRRDQVMAVLRKAGCPVRGELALPSPIPFLRVVPSEGR